MAVTRPIHRLTGDDLLGMVAAAQDYLATHAAQVDALNVFPVPDGDTGTNMLLTMKAAEQQVSRVRGQRAGVVAAAIAHETMMGARGNSGVILSQFFMGMARALEGHPDFGAGEVAQALAAAAAQAYKGVSKPVEGTMLTVMRMAAEAAQRSLAEGCQTPAEVWDAACRGARDALAQTPELLPVLKQAGVVDAGGLGMVALLEGAWGYLHGQAPRPLELPLGFTSPKEGFLVATAEEAFGYCTQFVVQGTSLDVAAVRQRIEAMSVSTIVVGDQTAIMVHAHAADPGPLMSYGITLGSLSGVKIENMDRQHQGFMALHQQGQYAETAALGVVAVVAGAGIERVFQEHGVRAIVQGGQTMNPSARDLLDAVERANAREVILLPNNSNIIGAARQAAALSQQAIHVLPSLSIPQGIAALLAFDAEVDAATNLARMQQAMGHVRSGEVTRAVRSATFDGVAVREGQAIALLDGKLAAAGESPLEALEALYRQAGLQPGTLVTLYWGGSATEALAAEAAQRLGQWFPEVDVEVHYGGQPHYEFLVGLE